MPRDPFKVKAGDPILPAWEKVQAWVRSLKVIPHPGCRVTRSPKGTFVVALRDRSPWNHPFRVRLGENIRVRTGTIGGRVPYVRDALNAGRLRPLDGREDGVKGDIPELEFDPELVAEDDSFCVALRIMVDDGGLLPEEPDAATIVQIPDIAAPPEDGATYFALAKVFVSEGIPAERFQVAHHNLQFQAMPAEGRPRVVIFPT